MTGEIPDVDMPDKDPLGDWRPSAMADDENSGILEDAEKQAKPE